MWAGNLRDRNKRKRNKIFSVRIVVSATLRRFFVLLENVVTALFMPAVMIVNELLKKSFDRKDSENIFKYLNIWEYFPKFLKYIV